MGNRAAQSSDDQDRLRLRIDIATDSSALDANAVLLAQKFLQTLDCMLPYFSECLASP